MSYAVRHGLRINMKRIVIYVYSEIGIEEIFRVSKEANGSQMGNLEFHPTQRTSTWGYFFYEFWRIGFRVTFGQYYIQLGFVICRMTVVDRDKFPPEFTD